MCITLKSLKNEMIDVYGLVHAFRLYIVNFLELLPQLKSQDLVSMEQQKTTTGLNVEKAYLYQQ